jgi:hypothetical protein
MISYPSKVTYTIRLNRYEAIAELMKIPNMSVTIKKNGNVLFKDNMYVTEYVHITNELKKNLEISEYEEYNFKTIDL